MSSSTLAPTPTKPIGGNGSITASVGTLETGTAEPSVRYSVTIEYVTVVTVLQVSAPPSNASNNNKNSNNSASSSNQQMPTATVAALSVCATAITMMLLFVVYLCARKSNAASKRRSAANSEETFLAYGGGTGVGEDSSCHAPNLRTSPCHQFTLLPSQETASAQLEAISQWIVAEGTAPHPVPMTITKSAPSIAAPTAPISSFVEYTSILCDAASDLPSLVSLALGHPHGDNQPGAPPLPIEARIPSCGDDAPTGRRRSKQQQKQISLGRGGRAVSSPLRNAVFVAVDDEPEGPEETRVRTDALEEDKEKA
ncbi:hypothetical protein BC830DRAFT_1128998 [Chytriomyces sp. MP71]|nr:hypothetical protein BC830DRAFT_1128998 [Chytriomyces sp. MP71]